MRRRGFLKNISRASMAPLFLNGMPINTLDQFGRLQEVAAQNDNDRVLVLIQMHGGNDGLNTLVPLNQYDRYRALRSNIALPNKGSRQFINLDGSLPSDQRLGLHPDTLALKQLYDQERVAVVQSVAYENMGGSHFRSRDVWLMGGDSNENLASGWAARYLDQTYPGYPTEYPTTTVPDPIALEIGSRVSLAFHRADGVPVALNVGNPDELKLLVSEGGGLPTSASSGSFYGQTLDYILEIERQSNQYAERLEKVYQDGKNAISYPERYTGKTSGGARNQLSNQLQTIARLLSGGCQTKIFLARITGFDTHGNQVERGDVTHGKHAALLHNMFTAVRAFQNDLGQLGLEDRVMTVTFSEFGRRAASNDSLGTDHGRAAPMFVFGKQVKPGVVGKNADLTQLDEKGNLRQQYDYRQVFATLLDDWLGASPSALAAARFDDFATDDQKLPLVKGSAPKPVNEPVEPKPTVTTTLADGTYELRPAAAPDKVLEVVVGDGDGDNVQQRSDQDQAYQRWQLAAVGNGYHRLLPTHDTERCLDAYKYGKTNGTNVQIWNTNESGQSNQEWKLVLEDESKGYYSLTPRYSDEQDLKLRLDVRYSSKKDGANLWLYRSNGTLAQRFVLERIDANARTADKATKSKVATPTLTSVKVYPNPAQHVVYVGGLTAKTSGILVQDMLGREVLQQRIVGSEARLDLTGMPKGVYHVAVEQAGKTETHKLVVDGQ